MGPKRDIVGELASATRRRGMVFGLSSHRAEHWWFMNGGMKFDSDVKDPQYADFYGPAQPDSTQPNRAFLDEWLARTCELVDRYQPQIVWFDWWIEQPSFKATLRRFAAYYYNRGAEWNRGVAINYKNDAYPPRVAVFDIERGQMADIRPLFWQTDTAVAKNSWGYVAGMDYKTADAIIGDLADIISKNGALLLNVGPLSDGTIPEEDQRILLEVGRWLAVNGEAVYATRPWKVFGEGPTEVHEGGFTDTRRTAFTAQDIRFTAKGQKTLYAIFLAWPAGELSIQSLGSNLRLYNHRIESVELLGSAEPVQWTREPAALTVRLPQARPCDHAFTLKITAATP
jgi:alpha-L-fucosidase